jgi:8-oxo-dGTP pyrophosphatase MutT (NUDIX family)
MVVCDSGCREATSTNDRDDIEGEAEVFEGKRYFSLDRDDHDTLFIRCSDEVLTIPLDTHGDVLLAVEPAPAFGRDVWVFSGGSVEPGEPHETTANRELREELGFAAGRLDFLGQLRPWSKYLTVRSDLYLARDLVASRLVGDEDYEIGVARVPLAAFEAFITSGQIQDARVIAGLYLARAYLQQHRD